MATANTYVGVDKDADGGLTSVGRIFRDAWVFDLIPETETGEGWDAGRVDDLASKVNATWDSYGHIPSRLPEELRQRHQRIYSETVSNARKSGWDPERYLDTDK